MAEIVLLAAVGAGLALTAASTLALRAARRRPVPKLSADPPGITILRPLKGVDPSLEANLETLYRQDYPGPWEVLVGAADPRDPALDVARRVAKAHPRTPSGVHPDAWPGALNPKAAVLARIVRRARFPVILVSDSNVALPPDALRDMAARLERPGVGLVSSPILGVPGRGPGAAMESLHLNTFVMGGVAALERVPGGVCVVGKSMMLRRRDLEAMGGFEALSRHLAEDQVCGEEVARRGQRCALSSVAVRNVLGAPRVRDFAARQVRWARIRRRMAPRAFLGEALLNPVFLAVLGAAALRTPAALALLAGTVLAKAALDAAAERAAGFRRPLLHYPPLVLAKDLLVGGLFLVSLLGNGVEWRGKRYRLGPRTLLVPEGGRAPAAAPSPVPEPVGEPVLSHGTA
jgi:ceramide glucosyltransferase